MKERYKTNALDATERPRKRYSYYVTGRGKFPYDMLRYDACWPVTSRDAADIDADGFRSILMDSYREPTIDRWSSFVWSVGTERLK